MPQSQEPRAAYAEQQQALKQELREAFARGDWANCWAWTTFDNEVTTSAMTEVADGEVDAHAVDVSGREGNVVRLIQHVGSNYLFASDGRHYRTNKRWLYMAHESQFFIRWIGNGPNVNGSQISGGDCESAWQANASGR